MSKRNYIITSESIGKMHPDKCMDILADSFLDEALSQDKNAQMAVECSIKDDVVFIFGEATTTASLDYEEIARKTLKELGFENEFRIIKQVSAQSPDINQAVVRTDELCAGDQGLMYGFATNETPEFMPLPITISHKLMKRYGDYIKTDNRFKGDAKSQVSVIYNQCNKPIGIDTVLISASHVENITLEEIRKVIKLEIINKVLEEYQYLDLSNVKYIINPSGKFTIYSSFSDGGTVGRKIICDTYGGVGRHGGGCFCVDGETEYLTKSGWKKINQYNGIDKIAQWDKGELSFVNPYYYYSGIADRMWHIRTKHHLDMVLSQNHDMVFITSKGNIIKKQVKDAIKDGNFINGSCGRIPCSFTYSKDDGVDLTDDEIRLQVAVCADGNLPREKDYCRIKVKREYKKERLIYLLSKTNIYYSKSDYDDGYTSFNFIPPIYDKSLKNCFQKANTEQLKVIGNEVVEWDGNRDNCFRTTIKEDADFVQFVFMAVYNVDASILTSDRTGKMFSIDKNYGEYERKSIDYLVYKLKNKDAGLRKKGDEFVAEVFTPSDGMMYCFAVPSGMLVLRRNDRVFITGNSSKSPTKVDRSGAYYARYVAKNIVANNLADKCEIQIAYGIGIAKPISLYIDCFGTEKIDLDNIYEIIENNFDFSVGNIIKELDLLRPIYKQTACYGHFGRKGFP